MRRQGGHRQMHMAEVVLKNIKKVYPNIEPKKKKKGEPEKEKKNNLLVTEEGECWFDSPIIAEYIELMNVAPAMLPRDPLESLRVRKIEALADGIMDAGLVSVREQARPAAQQSEDELLRQREKINRSLDVLEGYLVDGTLKTDTVNLATIAIACAVGYLNFRRVAPGWCVDRPHLVKLVENLFSRESFARTEPPKA